MADEDKEDKNVLDLLRAHDKEAADLADQLLSKKITYPIHDEKEFVKAVGGADTKVTVGGKAVTVGSLMSKAPAYYFPIADQHELVAKIADLSLQHHGPGSAAAGKLKPAKGEKPSHTPPKISDQDIQNLRKEHHGMHVGGFKKQQ